MPEPIVEARHGNRLIDIFPFLMKNFWRKIDNIIMPAGTYLQTDKVKAKSSSGLLLVDDSDTEGLKVEDGGAVSVAGNWRLKSETEGGTERLTVTAVGANSASELFLHPTGSANTSRLTITDAVNSVNYEGIEIEATASANRIGSIAAGTGTVQGLQFQISNSTKMTLGTNGFLGINTTNPQVELEVARNGAGNSAIAISDPNDSYTARVKLWHIDGSGGAIDLFNDSQTITAKIRSYASSDVQAYFTAGNVGFGTTGPQGLIEGFQSTGQFLFWSGSGTYSSATTVWTTTVNAITVMYLVMDAGTNTLLNGTVKTVDKSGTQNLYSSGGDTIVIGVSAVSDDVYIQRTAGSKTYDVALWMIGIN